MSAQTLFRGVKDDFHDLAHSINTWGFWKSVLMTAVGCTIFSIGINGILIPHKYLSSGTTGIALVLFYLLKGPSLGLIYWLINIPILIVGWRSMSLKYVVLAIIGVFVSGAAMQLTHDIRIPTPDPLMAAIIAGVITGTGVGTYLRFGGSAGGVDVVATLIRRKFGIPMGTTFISVNAVNFVAGALMNDMNIAFYTAIAMYVHSRVVESVQTGFSQRKAAFIVTREPDAVAEQVMKRLNRGVTFLEGAGGMSKRPTRVVYTIINMVELARLKEIIFHIDPTAFLSVNNTAEVIGNRFVTWEEQGYGKSRAQRALEPAVEPAVNHGVALARDTAP